MVDPITEGVVGAHLRAIARVQMDVGDVVGVNPNRPRNIFDPIPVEDAEAQQPMYQLDDVDDLIIFDDEPDELDDDF